MRAVLIGFVCCFLLACSALADTPNTPTAWRAGWLTISPTVQLATVITQARELQFDALIFSAPLDTMPVLARQVRQGGLEVYYWFGPQLPANQPTTYEQVLSGEEQKAFQTLMQDTQRYAHGYQGGGEPLPGKTDIWEGAVPCFHYPVVRQATLEHLRAVLRSCPDLTSIALDGFGYQNLHDCHCAESERQAQAYCASHPKLTPAVAREHFFFETLVAFQNEVAAEARRLNPHIKLTAHLWPAYAPQPIYGNNLNIEYCGQTTAWFFHPYWSDDKITQYTRQVVKEANRTYSRQQGIPFMGYFSGPTDIERKPAAQFEHELRLIFQATPSRSLSIFSLNDLLANPDAIAAMKKVYREFKILPQ